MFVKKFLQISNHVHLVHLCFWELLEERTITRDTWIN